MSYVTRIELAVVYPVDDTGVLQAVVETDEGAKFEAGCERVVITDCEVELVRGTKPSAWGHGFEENSLVLPLAAEAGFREAKLK